MVLLQSIASFNVADLFTKPLSRHRYTPLFIGIGVDPPSPFAASAASTATADPVDLTPTSVASTTAGASTVVASPTTSASVPVVLGTGASFAHTPFALDFALEIAQAPYGLIRSAFNSVVPTFKVSSEFASTLADPYTLITGEDAAVDLLFSDRFDFDSNLDTIVDSPSQVSFDIREFGTASLTFIYSILDLIKVFVTPTQIDWLHWAPLPRLILTESYFHIFGLDYLQAFTLFHLIPIWIYCLLHFAVNLD